MVKTVFPADTYPYIGGYGQSEIRIPRMLISIVRVTLKSLAGQPE